MKLNQIYKRFLSISFEPYEDIKIIYVESRLCRLFPFWMNQSPDFIENKLAPTFIEHPLQEIQRSHNDNEEQCKAKRHCVRKIMQSTSKDQNLVNEDFDNSYYYRGLPFGLSHFINWLKNSMRNVLLNDSIPLTESGGRVTAETENNKEMTETSIKEILLTSCLNYKPVFLTRTHGILFLSFINSPCRPTFMIINTIIVLVVVSISIDFMFVNTY
ncbi:hypothetical protein BpHYR1_006521 [Brachionus plicatilis]|uniref:Uncharacterized protein n=1 Tax=Brachionus plicatilis TaxID=10195 RepID=A0A3M7RRQ8_BRAPC|nr:hypothetical protein BpHYR1_006521 [Brachionus plicatilis]